jgi:hypothetical protein
MATRKLLTPDYAGSIRNGINENLNGVRTSSSNFSVPSIYSGTDKNTPRTKPKEMSRTSGVMGHKDIYSSTLFGVQTVNKGERYRAPNNKEMFGPIDTRPGWMQTSDAVRKNYDRFGTANPSFGQIAADAVGIGTDRSGNFQFDPALAAMSFAPVGRILGPLGKIFGAGKKLIPAALRFDTAAANIVGRSARTLRRATGAAEDASWAGDRAAELFNAGKKRASTPIRTSRNIYEDVGHGAFDENLGTRLTGENVFGSSLADAEAAVRAGLAKVEYTGNRTKVYRDLVGEGWQREAEAAAKIATEKRLAAEALARRSEAVLDRGIGGTKSELKRRVAALREAQLREARLRAAGVPIAPKRGGPPEVY